VGNVPRIPLLLDAGESIFWLCCKAWPVAIETVEIDMFFFLSKRYPLTPEIQAPGGSGQRNQEKRHGLFSPIA